MDSFKARAGQAIYQAKEDGRNRVQIALAAKKSVAFCLMVQGLRRMKAETGMHDASSARRNSQVAQALPGARLGPCLCNERAVAGWASGEVRSLAWQLPLCT